MNELKLFENPKFGQVRTVEINDKIYFVAADVAKSLGYAKPQNAISMHCKGALKRSIPTNGGNQEMNVIPEGDIYRLAAKSELPGADEFESWIFDEVLPSIRKHGAYMTDDTIEKAILNPDFLIRLATELKDERALRYKMQDKIESDKPKVIFADAVSSAHTSILIGDLAKLIKQNGVEIGQKRLFAWLRENGYLIKRMGADYNMPMQRYMEQGLFDIKETAVTHSDGHISVSKTVKVTGKGQQYFINKFLS